jgi:hypothetical protein
MVFLPVLDLITVLAAALVPVGFLAVLGVPAEEMRVVLAAAAVLKVEQRVLVPQIKEMTGGLLQQLAAVAAAGRALLVLLGEQVVTGVPDWRQASLGLRSAAPVVEVVDRKVELLVLVVVVAEGLELPIPELVEQEPQTLAVEAAVVGTLSPVNSWVVLVVPVVLALSSFELGQTK